MTTLSRQCAGTNPVEHGLSDDDGRYSLIYAFLPPLVRRTVPKVSSLRRSFSNYRSSRTHSRSSSMDETECGTVTPPPAYHEALAPLMSVLGDDESASEVETSAGFPKATTFSENDTSGIQWKYASQGLNLYTLSAQESASSTSDRLFSRQLYVDATTYLLRGLPEDLTEEELISLRAATPHIMIQPQTPVGQLIGSEGGPRDVWIYPQDPGQIREPTVLHRLVSVTVLQFFVIVSFLWPYFRVFARNAYDYERQYHISERFATSTWTTAHAIGKQTVATANLVCTWNDGQLGETLESMFAWWVQGVAGGLCEGLGEGMEVLGVKQKPTRVQRRKGVASPRAHRA